MNAALIDQVVNDVLYEGSILYPYRASSNMNPEQSSLGRVYPEDYTLAQRGAEPCAMQTECLVRGPAATVEITVRFLQPVWREVLAHGVVVPEFEVDGKLLQTRLEAIERALHVPAIGVADLPRIFHIEEFAFPQSLVREPEVAPGVIIRRRQDAIAGALEISGEALDNDLTKITVCLGNRTPVPEAALTNQDAVLLRTFASAHTVLRADDGEFVSLLNPPAEDAAAVATCHNIGVWPVLVGDRTQSERTTMLASPIILQDYPQIAPERARDPQGAEIDEP